MTNCTFQPERDSQGHIGVDDRVAGEKVRLHLCQDCVEVYRQAQEEHL